MPRFASLRPCAALSLGAPLALTATLAAPLGAQTRYAITPFVAANSTLSGPTTLWGVALAASPGVLGVRASGAGAGVRTTPDAAGSTRHALAAWTADADAVLNVGAVPGISMVLGGFAPALFAGVGAEGGRDGAAGAAVSSPVVSYGAGVARALIGGVVGVETEARYRVPTAFDGGTPPSALRRGWEYRLGLSLRFGGRGAASSGSASGPLPRWPAGGGTAGGARPSASAARVISTADDYLGTPYKYGGTTPAGFDCSGFVQYVFRKQGVELPRTSRQQAGAGERVSAAARALRPGDLMLFDASGADGTIDHVAIYAGNDRMIHASASGGGVRYDDLSTKRGEWFLARMVAARRVLADGRSLVNSLDQAYRESQPLDPPDRAPKP